MTTMDLTPPILAGRHVRLEPLDERHAPGLFRAMQDEEVCRYLGWAPPERIEDTLAIITLARALQARGDIVPFAQVEVGSGECVGTTRLLDVRPADRQVEIGATLVARPLWRTPINTEAKRLLLGWCFEALGCVRVALKADARNARSLAAIERLGAKREGVLRKHMNVRGYQRDTVYFSILDDEWPAVRARLDARLADA
jgi:RimJ/RimL family protein N-acetyltransferase